MGSYLNPGNIEFQESLNSKIYIDLTFLMCSFISLYNIRTIYLLNVSISLSTSQIVIHNSHFQTDYHIAA